MRRFHLRSDSERITFTVPDVEWSDVIVHHQLLEGGDGALNSLTLRREDARQLWTDAVGRGCKKCSGKP